jgi:serine/threonine-protein kinase
MDFGLAKLIDAPTRPMHKVSDTGTDFAVGTPGYISPEQVRGDEMDHRSDLYSVGVILFELLTGKLPFTGGETMEVLLAHATEPPPSFADVGAGWIPPPIEGVVRSCLAKDKAERPPNALDLAVRFEEALAEEGPPTEFAPHTPYNGARREQKEQPAPPAPPSPVEPVPGAVVHHLEAWMPEAIASHKLRGFVYDVGGEVVESVPGTIRVRLGGKGSVYWTPGQGPLSWLGLGRRASLIDVELRLERNNPTQQSLLSITVLMRSPEGLAAETPAWKARANQVFCDLRAYLMGQGGSVADPVR